MGLLDNLLELLKLNKFFLAASVIWGFVMAFLELSQASMTCSNLYAVMWTFLTFGGVAIITDTVIEVIQDTLYTCSHRSSRKEKTFKFFNAPRTYSGISLILARKDPKTDKDCGTCCTDDKCCDKGCGCDRNCAFVVLLIETILRLAGNVFLFSLFVLTGVGKYTAADSKLCPCVEIINASVVFNSSVSDLCRSVATSSSGVSYLQWTQQVMPLFWMSSALIIARTIFAFTYEDYSPTPKQKVKTLKAKRQKNNKDLEKILDPDDRLLLKDDQEDEKTILLNIRDNLEVFVRHDIRNDLEKERQELKLDRQDKISTTPLPTAQKAVVVDL